MLEMRFPPFFDIMIHLLVHIVHEIKYLGHVYSIICGLLRGLWLFSRRILELKEKMIKLRRRRSMECPKTLSHKFALPIWQIAVNPSWISSG